MTRVVDDYLEHLEKQGLKETTRTTLSFRLRAITQMTTKDRLLSGVTPAIAAELYAARVAKVKPDTHRAELAAVGAMFAWCVKKGWLQVNPFAGVEPEGRKNVRTEHLHIDEARALRDVALSDVTDAGLAVAMALLLGLRASEVTNILVRDVDDSARVLWIHDAKTPTGNRKLDVPKELQRRLGAKTKGRPKTDRLFVDVDRQWLYYHVERLCLLAKVPVVSPHALRRTFSVIGAETAAIVDVARALGQKSAAVNRRHYQPTNAEERRLASVALRSLAGGKSS